MSNRVIQAEKILIGGAPVTPGGGGGTDYFVRADKFTGSQTLNSAYQTITNWDTEDDAGGYFDPTTGLFVAPATGFYQVDLAAALFGFTGTSLAARIKVNGVIKGYANMLPNVGSVRAVNPSLTLKLTIGDVVLTEVFQDSGGTVQYYTVAGHTVLTIYGKV
jgi:hypothetical protein